MSTSSFISEHTAEFFLLPRLFDVFEKLGKHAIPFYYWKTREGATNSRYSSNDKDIKLIAIFPRRPKVTKPNQSTIEVKINSSLYYNALVCKEFNVPVFAGLPLASSFLQLSSKVDCSWFYFDKFIEEKTVNDLFLEIDLDTKHVNFPTDSFVREVTEREIIELSLTNSINRKWMDCIKLINEIRFKSEEFTGYYNMFSPWIGIYRPFFIAIVD